MWWDGVEGACCKEISFGNKLSLRLKTEERQKPSAE
jgi:hypothetical protein